MLDTPEGRRVFGDYEAAFFNFVMASYTAGIRHGAAYENLRRSVVGELIQCDACWGVGATEDRDVCAACGGTGTVALRA
jgi:RecJ-like exonuclease